MHITRTHAALVTARHTVELVDVDLPALGPGDVLVEVAESGISARDLRVYLSMEPARFPYPVGRELGGEVVALGPGVTDLARGDRVAVWTQPDAGLWPLGLATHTVVPAAHCVATDVHHPAAIAPLARCLAAIEAADALSHRHIVIVGGGYDAQLLAGLLWSPWDAGRTRTVTVASRHADQLVAAVQRGATNTVQLDGEHSRDNAELVQASVREHTGGGAADLAIDTTGAEAEGLERMASFMGDGGVLVSVGDDPRLPTVPTDVRGHRRVPVPKLDFARFVQAVRRFEAGSWGMRDELTAYHSLDEVEPAVEYAVGRHPGHFRTVFDVRPRA